MANKYQDPIANIYLQESNMKATHYYNYPDPSKAAKIPVTIVDSYADPEKFEKADPNKWIEVKEVGSRESYSVPKEHLSKIGSSQDSDIDSELVHHLKNALESAKSGDHDGAREHMSRAASRIDDIENGAGSVDDKELEAPKYNTNSDLGKVRQALYDSGHPGLAETHYAYSDTRKSGARRVKIGAEYNKPPINMAALGKELKKQFGDRYVEHKAHSEPQNAISRRYDLHSVVVHLKPKD